LLLYYITDRNQFAGVEAQRRQRLLEKVTDAARCGIDYIQLREKDLSSRDLEELARAALRNIEISGSKTRLLINSRTDIALTVGADGIHLQSQDISPDDVRKIWREAKTTTMPIIAVSCHTEPEVIAAESSVADFVVFGPVFEKSRVSPTGLEGLRAACRHNIPVLALGGITLANARSCIHAGAMGIAGIRLFQEYDIELVVEGVREIERAVR
jgi:thiamine-phosphate pyrophosphorylase